MGPLVFFKVKVLKNRSCLQGGMWAAGEVAVGNVLPLMPTTSGFSEIKGQLHMQTTVTTMICPYSVHPQSIRSYHGSLTRNIDPFACVLF